MKILSYILILFLFIATFSSCVTVKPMPSVNNTVILKNVPTITQKKTYFFYNRNYRQYRTYNRYYYKPYYRRNRH